MGLKNKKIIYTSGAFDILNEGHINLLQKAKELGDYLIVGVSSNKLVKSYKLMNPIMTFKERSKIIKSLKFVDKVIMQNNFFDIKQLEKHNIDIILLGDDWKNKKFPELYKCLKELNIKMIYFPYTQSTSSSNIKKRIIKHSVEILEAQMNRLKNG